MESKNLKLIQVSGRTLIDDELVIPKELFDKLDLERILRVDSLGMSVEKVMKQKETIDTIVNNTETLVEVVSFININGYSNLMQSDKYSKEVDIVKKLGNAKLKQSFLRIYYGVFSEVNQLQKERKISNYFSKKALKLGLKGDYRDMHFAFEFDKRICANTDYLSLKSEVIKKK